MKPEEITVGETYNVRVKVVRKSDLFIHTKTCVDTALDGGYLFEYAEAEAFSPINSADGTKSAKNAQKYDPCRPFKAGDIVTPSPVKGRWFGAAWEGHREIRFTVTKDEDKEGTMWVQEDDSSTPIWVLAAFFQLISPVEELERYVVIHNDYEKYYEVCWKDDDEPDGRTGRTRCLTTFWYHNPPKTHTQKHAKAAAEAERDRLNAEYRKEQDND